VGLYSISFILVAEIQATFQAVNDFDDDSNWNRSAHFWRKTDLQIGLFLDEVALSTFLVVRFTLHNRSEGLAIVTPIAKTEAKKRTMIRRFVIIGWIAGIPTIAETWIGGFLYSPIAAAILLSVGAGAGAKFK
jgi:hypothetical protein